MWATVSTMIAAHKVTSALVAASLFAGATVTMTGPEPFVMNARTIATAIDAGVGSNTGVAPDTSVRAVVTAVAGEQLTVQTSAGESLALDVSGMRIYGLGAGAVTLDAMLGAGVMLHTGCAAPSACAVVSLALTDASARADTEATARLTVPGARLDIGINAH